MIHKRNPQTVKQSKAHATDDGRYQNHRHGISKQARLEWQIFRFHWPPAPLDIQSKSYPLNLPIGHEAATMVAITLQAKQAQINSCSVSPAFFLGKPASHRSPDRGRWLGRTPEEVTYGYGTFKKTR
jgi:hypothetical protein